MISERDKKVMMAFEMYVHGTWIHGKNGIVVKLRAVEVEVTGVPVKFHSILRNNLV